MTGATVHIVDGDVQVREALAAMAEHAGFLVRAHPTAEAFLAQAALDDAGCVVADVNLPGLDGLGLLERIGQCDTDLPVIVISGESRVAPAVAALKAGAVDFLQKPVGRGAFIRCLADALARRRRLAEQRRAVALAQRCADRLSERERDVMRLITAGASNQEAARRLGISVRTVENHRARVMEKMGATTLADLIRQALRLEDTAPARWAPSAPAGGELTLSPQ